MFYYPFIYLGGAPLFKSGKKRRQLENNYQLQMTFTRLLNEALERYHIEGLPDTLSERVILMSLLWYGCVVIFKKGDNLFCLPGAPTGNGYNVYGDPGQMWVYSVANGQYNQAVDVYIPGSDDDAFLKKLIGTEQNRKPTGVVVWDNRMRYPFVFSTYYYSKCITDCYRTLDITRYWLKRPLLLTGPEEYSESVKQMIDGMEENPSAVYVKQMVGVAQNTTLFNTNANGQNLQDVTGLLEWYESKYRELCGLDSNSQMDKKGENLITAEITVNDQYQEMSIDKCVDEVNRGLDNVNKFFNLNLKCIKNNAIKQPTEGENGNGQDNISGMVNGSTSKSDNISD